MQSANIDVPIKISEIDIDRLSYCCGIQGLRPKFSGSCDASPMPWNDKLLTIAPTSYAIGYTVGNSQIANKFPPYNINYSPSGYTYSFSVSSYYFNFISLSSFCC